MVMNLQIYISTPSACFYEESTNLNVIFGNQHIDLKIIYSFFKYP